MEEDNWHEIEARWQNARAARAKQRMALAAMHFDLEALLQRHSRQFLIFSMRWDLISEQRSAEEELSVRHESELPASILDDPWSDVITLIKSLEPSFLAPAWHFNHYIENYEIDVFWDDIKEDLAEDDRPSNIMRRVQFQIPAQGVLTSIKTALDRLVPLLSYYFKGFSPSTTFGRIGSKNQGFMSFAKGQSETDTICRLMVDHYTSWIRAAVEPRDTITHYNDMGLTFGFDPDSNTELPQLLGDRLIGATPLEGGVAWTPASLKAACGNWYRLFDQLMAELVTRELIVMKAHF